MQYLLMVLNGTNLQQCRYSKAPTIQYMCAQQQQVTILIYLYVNAIVLILLQVNVYNAIVILSLLQVNV